MKTAQHRAIWISDTHLGTPECKADLLLDFLRSHDAAHLYLVGDIFDCWRLTRHWYWKDIFDELIECVQEKVANGTLVTYVPGNHDDWLRDHCERVFDGVKVKREVIHETADGRRVLVFHGDELDDAIRMSSWLVQLGDWSYDRLLWWNGLLNRVRKRLGQDYWSLTAFIKSQVQNARRFTDEFEHAAAARGRARGMDGVICGHIHQARIRTIEGIEYHNCGDWVESCSALVESHDGAISLVEHTRVRQAATRVQPQRHLAAGTI